MVQPSSVRYARVGDVSLAYQVLGSGPATIVAIPPLAQNIELMWERPEYRRMLHRLGAFATVVHYDKRGTGASDRTRHMPTVDERVEDLRAVLDDAGVVRAHLLGVSEGGPVALLFAATYPDRVDGVVVMSSGARIVGDETAVERDARRRWNDRYAECWGTAASMTLDTFAPSAAADVGYRSWQPRYERQSASPAALRDLLRSLEVIDVRPVLPSIGAPVLVLHRRDDGAVPLDRAAEVAAAIPHARLVVLDGIDHAAHVGDVDAWIDEVEAFTTGGLGDRPSDPVGVAAIQVMGGFAVRRGGEEVPLAAWGSRRARQLCKRLAVAAGRPVPREQLIEQLWPDEVEEVDEARLGARLSVLLSTVRRVLGGGLVADRAAVRLDLDQVQLDLQVVEEALRRGDDRAAVAAHRGPVLPEDAYEDWASAVRDRLAGAVADARRRLAAQAADAGRHDEAAAHARAILELDPYDERAHEQLVRALVAAGRHGAAGRAAAAYERRMDELGVPAAMLLQPGGGPPDRV